MDDKADVAVALCTDDAAMMVRWREFIETKTFATVTIAATHWVDVVADPMFPPDIVMMVVGSSSIRALRVRTHACRQLGVLVILADPDHLIDDVEARKLDILFVIRDESEADRTLAAVRAYRLARATGHPMRIPLVPEAVVE
ncbi:hypothetical protein [Herbiconiux daphne]|uniref:DNA-binding response regulator n=1 Tax=Herbiconiux daphne TaxID=2970914 RepID=A0ABT2H0P1_9MICO|nr:hypothetical protein [Herbiconiux daphne]MCS5733499.1 hypothetical protein [Herbiconiux daphne]